MRGRSMSRIVVGILAGALAIGGGVPPLGQVAKPLTAAAATAPVLNLPTTLHGDGAELSWSRFVPDATTPFTAYEVHRSATAAFTPSASTLLTTISDLGTTRYRDTTAKAAAAFSYKIRVGTLVSAEQRVTLPAAGTSSKILQPLQATGQASYVAKDTTTPATCYNDYNYGAAAWMRTGPATNGVVHRPVLRFDLRDIPASATVSAATLTLNYAATTSTVGQVNVHRLTQPWVEGTGTGQCNASGVSWNETQRGARWSAAGGSYDAAIQASVAAKSRSAAGVDNFTVTNLVRQWVSGTPNHGLMIKSASEALPTVQKYFDYRSDDYGTTAQKPKLSVTYADGSTPRAPRVSVVDPVAGQPVAGTAVPLSASAADDGRVAKVEFLVDGVVVATDTAAPWSATWNSTGATTGTPTVTARATDDAGNVSTSAGRTVVVDNSAAPSSAAVTAPAAGSTLTGTVTVNASAADDQAVTKVEFYADDELFATVTAAPWTATWDTLDALRTAFDGPHALTVKAYDAGNRVRSSSAVGVTVGNTVGTSYIASYDLNELGNSDDAFAIPPTILGNSLATPVDPGTGTSGTKGLSTAPKDSTLEYNGGASASSIGPDGAVTEADEVPPPPDVVSPNAFQADVTVTNNSAVAWKNIGGTDLELWYRWYTNDGVVLFEGPGTDYFPQTVQPGQSKRIPVTVEPPALPLGTDLTQVRLRFDIYDKLATTLNKWFAGRGNPPIDNPVIVEKNLEGALGLEKYWQYEGEAAGAGLNTMTNVANGNMLWRWSPFYAPGRGLASMLDLTYNSLEDHSESPAGNNVSLSISGLTRWGYGLDIHPNKADEISGKSRKYVVLTDGDGTTHEFTGVTNPDGTTTWTEPAGVNLYLRSSTDPVKHWALTRPDNVTFWFDADGYPTYVSDRNGNELRFELQNTPAGEDPGGPKRRIVKVHDAAGRFFEVDYYSKAEAKKAHVRGKIQRIYDHSRSVVDFDYYEDGNLLRITQRGGTQANGDPLADRSFVFTYTVPNGTGPAISDPALRANPDPRTPSQSTRLFSIRDPRATETTFAYYGPSEGSQLRWKLKSRTNRAAKTTTFAYNTTSRITTVNAPLSRDTDYTYDATGRVTRITDPAERPTTIAWTTDNQVSRVTEPTGVYTAFTYNHNGRLLTKRDQVGATTTLTYDNRTLDPRDAAGHWSVLTKVTPPKGATHATTWTNDAAGNPTVMKDAAGFETGYTWNLAGSTAPGTVARIDRPRGAPTTYTYDASGQPSRIDEGGIRVTTMGYDVDGQLIWSQDPNHQTASGADVRSYRTYFDYDAFHRLGRQSAPRSTSIERGRLIWSSVTHDANDNLVRQVDPHYSGSEDSEAGGVSTTTYDPMDRPVLRTNPDTSVDPAGERTSMAYDDAGRLVTTTLPKGVLSTAVAGDFEVKSTYDVLDQVVSETQTGVSATDLRRTFACYDLAGDLRSVTSPRAGLTSLTCPATATQAFTTRYAYDDAHKVVAQTDPLGNESRTTYDLHGNVTVRERDIDATRVERTETFYDVRDLPQRAEQLFDSSTGRKLSSQIEYDANGNKVKSISPRAFDFAGGSAPFDSYVTTYEYDPIDRLVKTTLPVASAMEEKQYMHHAYDANGNVLWSSLPVTSVNAADVRDTARTSMTYFDAGWIRSTKKPTQPLEVFDYFAQGWQQLRTPERTAQPGTPDLEREMRWDYYLDGGLRTRTDRDGNVNTYSYDAHNNLTRGLDASGVTAAADAAIETVATWTGFDQPDKVKHRDVGAATWRFSDYTYDSNGNVTVRLENGEESASTGAQTKAPRRHELTYDDADWLVEQRDLGVDAACVGDQRILNTYWSTGAEKQRDIFRGKAGCAADVSTWKQRQRTTWEHFDNGKLSKLRTHAYKDDGSSRITESHDVGYFEGDRYENGNRVTDRFVLERATGSTATKCVGTASCLQEYDYDARGKVVRHQKQEGDVATYALDESAMLLTDTTIRAGNVTTEVNNGKTLKKYYESNQLRKIEEVGKTGSLDYRYDDYGNVDCVTLGAQASCPNGTASLVTDYTYDGLDRLVTQRQYGAGVVTDSAEYTYDALDRVTKEAESHDGTSDDRSTDFTFEGLTSNVTEEKQTGGLDPKTKTFSYDAFGHRIAMTDTKNATPTVTDTYTYSNDVHGSVSQLISDAGAVRASYGYDAYGGQDTEDNVSDSLSTGDLNDKAPLNPYRYTAKRLDSGSATATKSAASMDLGARRYGIDTGRFLQEDMYTSALGDLGLTLDPLSGNRYSLAGGNPVSFVEYDGHMLIPDGGGGGSPTPTPDPDDSGVDNQDDGDYASLLAKFTNEINTNIDSDEVASIKAMNDTINYYLSDEPAWWERIFQPDIGSLSISALSAWTAKVCQKICEWDHKPEIEEEYGMGEGGKDHFTQVPGTNKELYYDVWSNIHYGYVGRASGFDAETLLGAQASQIPVVGSKDPGDDISVQIGIDLYDEYGEEGLTSGQLDQAIRAAFPQWEDIAAYQLREMP
ncbi:MAG TPA: Ig-like domain-containing protein [Kribbellaceae bacterium]|nr:Ig-like domain-containing protein [Kribbellaceae bacterium]